MMKIINHRLMFNDTAPVPFVKSNNVGGKLEPEYLIIHYTAGTSVEGAISTLTTPGNQKSAHLVIGRDGSITQLVPFNQVAWHAGESRWEGRSGLNDYSIGIELDNAGELKRKGDHWVSGFGHEYELNQAIEATHIYGKRLSGWHKFTDPQIEKVVEIGILLSETYNLLGIAGHDEISPGRKWDPGPAFPINEVRSWIFEGYEIKPFTYETTNTLQIRFGPGVTFPTTKGSPLPPGVSLDKIGFENGWFKVNILEEVNGINNMQGWVFSKYIKRVNT